MKPVIRQCVCVCACPKTPPEPYPIYFMSGGKMHIILVGDLKDVLWLKVKGRGHHGGQFYSQTLSGTIFHDYFCG